MSQPSWEPDYIDDEVARAIAHPLRAQILAEVNTRVMSPNQFAKRHNLDVSQVAYHFRQLEQRYGLVEMVAKVPVRGATEHFFKATRRGIFDGKSWASLPETVKNKISGQAITNLLGAIADAMLEETFDERSDRALAWDTVILDEQGFGEVAKIFRQALDRTLKVSGKAEKRLAKSGEEPLLATWALLFFKSPFKEPELEDGS